ncbi:MAG: hypothetical protein E6I91_09430 [Chloroflexi bacterium]|nr:MAG: hypothetical protein E6I91_09430 [Chloroflexota bacterium]
MSSAGGLIGTSVSALFLYLIAFINILVLWEVFQAFQKVKRGEEYNDQTLNEFLNRMMMQKHHRIAGSASWLFSKSISAPEK